SVIAGPEAGRWLLRGTPLVRGRPMTPRRLAAHADFAIRLNRSRTGAMNVACRIPGSAPETGDTALAFTAHYDHLGVGEPDATGDSIYNGFSDNAAGVAMLLAIG
ncbi:MAG: M28 family peptidase, partial [Gammaproteobacteria bacterium]|nr:M28 family peptidase [Gemmatimonadota bacterium]NIU75046.1 M28 family peptidase [Gammaproteobacteria bacterium]